MDDKQLIEQGKKLVSVIERSQMRLGELALEYAPIGEKSVKTGMHDRIREYAEAVGVEEATMRAYRSTAHSWQGVETGETSFTVLKALASVPNKAGLLEELGSKKPDTKSGRWTAAAAIDYARNNGYWTHAGRGASPAVRPDDMVAALNQVSDALQQVLEMDLDEKRRELLLQALETLEKRVRLVREKLTEREVAPARAPEPVIALIAG